MTRRLFVFFAFQFLLYQCANRAACKDPLEFQYKWLDENNNLTDEKDSRMADDNNNNKPLIVFIHGYFTSLQNPYYAIFGKSLAKWTGSRVAFVGWSDWTLGVIYPELVQKMPALANRLADWLNGLRDRGTLKSFDQVTLIGHSLGAQMIGLVGHRFNGTFKRIIALDPAGPWFTAAAKNERVDKKSGRFVMVLHTSTTIWGLREPTGHVDFYFDGGKKQTLCGLDLDSMCSHVVVFEYFIQSLRNSSALKAQRCRTLEDCEAKTVDSNEPAVYMTINLSPTTRGLYSITPTKNVLDLIELPFCLTCIVAVGGLWLVLDRVLLRRVSVTWSARQLLWNNPTVSYLLDTSYYHRRTAADRLNCSAYDDTDRCQHGGLLEPTDDGFRCKCTPDYDGKNCANEKTLKLDITWPKIPWNLFKFGADLQEVYTSHQNRVEDFNEKMFSDGSGSRKGLRGSNLMTSARILPSSRPLQCPTDKRLPPLEMLYDQVFRPKLAAAAKKHDRNVLHHIFYQYFILQYFNTDFELKVSASQLYGADPATKTALRSFSNGKLKTDVSNGQHFPPSMSSVEWFKTVYPPTKRNLNPQWFNRIKSESSGTFSSKLSNLLGPSKRKRHAGHPMLNENPILDAMSTLWVREHNRVCDLLTQQWPSWADQEIYDTARRIVIGEMMVITMNEILSVKFKPELFRDRIRNVQSSNTPFELLLISNMWPSGLPSRFENATLFDPNSGVFENGIDNDTTSAKTTEPMTRLMLTLSREKAVQSLNSYRRHAGLPAYRGFTELTGGDGETAERLRSVYEDDVERVELLPGIAAERKRKGRSPTAAALTEAFVVNSILTHPLASSNESWSPVTFGGDAGFHAVQSATLESLICNNLSTDTDCATLRQLLSSDHRVRFARDVFAYAAACLVPVTIFGFKYAVSRRRRLVPGGGGGGEDQWRIRTGDRPSHPFAYRVLAAILAALPKVFIVFLHVSDPRNAFRLYRKLYRLIFRTVLGLGPLLPKLLLCCSFAVSVAITTAYVLFFYKLYVYKLSHPYTDISPVFTDNIVSYIVLTVSVICMGNHFYLLFI